jgi:hypothetical protein
MCGGGNMRTELSVTLSYLPNVVSDGEHRGTGYNLLLQDFAESRIVQLDVRA